MLFHPLLAPMGSWRMNPFFFLALSWNRGASGFGPLRVCMGKALCRQYPVGEKKKKKTLQINYFKKNNIKIKEIVEDNCFGTWAEPG